MKFVLLLTFLVLTLQSTEIEDLLTSYSENIMCFIRKGLPMKEKVVEVIKGLRDHEYLKVLEISQELIKEGYSAYNECLPKGITLASSQFASLIPHSFKSISQCIINCQAQFPTPEDKLKIQYKFCKEKCYKYKLA